MTCFRAGKSAVAKSSDLLGKEDSSLDASGAQYSTQEPLLNSSWPKPTLIPPLDDTSGYCNICDSNNYCTVTTASPLNRKFLNIL